MDDQGKGVHGSGKTSTDVGAETWAVKKTQQNNLEIAEMLDRIRNERISGTTKVGAITKKVLQRRLSEV